MTPLPESDSCYTSDMESETYSIRRATLDDLPALRQLWEDSALPSLDLEKHLTEFQVVVNAEGQLLGAVGLRLQRNQGLLHSEAYVYPETAEMFQPQMWERLQVVARNHGLARIWTLEEGTFWTGLGFQPATDEKQISKIPAEFGPQQAKWRVLPLREETEALIAMEKEFEVFQAANRESTERLMRQAQTFKIIAYILLTIVFLAGAYVAFKYVSRNPIRLR